MGLDVSFSRSKAIAAGMQLKMLRNGTDEESRAAYEQGDDSYAQWLLQEEECIEIPTVGGYTSNHGCDDRISVRANKWGMIYYPLTAWLRENGILWDEY
jgi:hypothetical protein